jgi:type II secretion system protein G
MNLASKKRRGFTLIEILIVVVILGILAAIVIPQFTNASQEATASSIRSQLQTIRGQVELFRVRNGGAAPTGFADLMTPPGDQAPYLSQTPVLPAGFEWNWGDNDATADVIETLWVSNDAPPAPLTSEEVAAW